MNTPSTGAPRAITTPCGRYFDLGGGCHVTLAEFERMTELVGPAFLEDPPDEAAQAEFDEICEAGIARAKASTNAASR